MAAEKSWGLLGRSLGRSFVLFDYFGSTSGKTASDTPIDLNRTLDAGDIENYGHMVTEG